MVEELDRAVPLYRDGLGLVLDRFEDIPERGVRVAFLSLGGTRIELIESTRPDSEVAAWIARHGEGLHHVALAVEDLDSALAGARKKGAEAVPGRSRRGAGGKLVAFLHPKTTFGVLVELVEHEKLGRS